MSNKITALREYPQLPILTMAHATSVLKVVKLNATTVAHLTGYSRMSVSRWFRDIEEKPQKPSLDAVSTLAYKVLRAIKQNNLPMENVDKMTDLKVLVPLLSDSSYEKPLANYTPEELLPEKWQLVYLTPVREQDAIA